MIIFHFLPIADFWLVFCSYRRHLTHTNGEVFKNSTPCPFFDGFSTKIVVILTHTSIWTPQSYISMLQNLWFRIASIDLFFSCNTSFKQPTFQVISTPWQISPSFPSPSLFLLPPADLFRTLPSSKTWKSNIRA